MSNYIYFTPEEKARAQNTDLVSLLRTKGERPIRSGREYRTPNDPSVTVRGNKWYDHSERVGGARRKNLCKRYSTKSRMALKSRADSGLNPLFTESHGGQNGMRAGTA